MRCLKQQKLETYSFTKQCTLQFLQTRAQNKFLLEMSTYICTKQFCFAEGLSAECLSEMDGIKTKMASCQMALSYSYDVFGNDIYSPHPTKQNGRCTEVLSKSLFSQ